jgi:hypothetical protein
MINVIQRNSTPSDQPDGITKTHRSKNPPQKGDPAVPDAERLEGRISAVVPSLPPTAAIARMARQTLVPLRTLLVFLAISFCFSVYTVIGQSTAGNGDIGSVLVVGKFRTQEQLNGMSPEDQRNTLITELVGRTKDGVKYYQSLNDSDLAGAGALLVYLRGTGSRTDPQIKTMSADDMRNTVIVEVGAKTGRGRELQALSNMDLVKMVFKLPTKRQEIRAVRVERMKGVADFIFETAVGVAPTIEVSERRPQNNQFRPEWVIARGNGPLQTRHRIRVNIPKKAFITYYYVITAGPAKEAGDFSSPGTFD